MYTRYMVICHILTVYSFQAVTEYNLPAWLAPLTLLIETISSSTLFSIHSICNDMKHDCQYQTQKCICSSAVEMSAQATSSVYDLSTEGQTCFYIALNIMRSSPMEDPV